MSHNEQTLLRLENVSRTYEKKGQIIKALKPLSFDLTEGEILGIVGESGSGKTTLLKQVIGIEKPDTGRIILNGNEIDPTRRQDQKELYKSMQMIFQNAVMSFNPRRKICASMDENLKFLGGVSGKGKRREIMAQYMEMVELDPSLLDRYPGELSGGQCQRAAIARALMIKPKILLCDEVTSALDVIVQDKIIELLTRLSRELSVSMIFICHDLALVSGFCDRVLVMKQGECVEQGNCEMVLSDPQNPYTKQLLASVLSI